MTPREREVFPLVVGGLLNKQAASILGISEVTLKTHRCQVMLKMQAESFAELVRMAMKLRIIHPRETQLGLERQSKTSMFVVRNGWPKWQPNKMRKIGFSVCGRTYLQIQSRRACPELAERGRLKIILGLN